MIALIALKARPEGLAFFVYLINFLFPLSGWGLIFITMVRKNKQTSLKDNELYILPSPSEEMRTFVNKFRIDMMEHIVSSIKFAIEHELPIVEVFQFKNSPFVVTIAEREFEPNLEHINKFYVENEMYELCPKVEVLRQLLKKKTDEKEKSETDDRESDESDNFGDD